MTQTDSVVDLGPGPDRIERWEKLVSLLDHNQKLTVEGVSTQLQVSRSTVRRDFDELAVQGLATRVRGGVVARPQPRVAPAHAPSVVSPEDRRIATYACSLVRAGMAVGMSGTPPVVATSRLLAERPDLAEYSRDAITVVTSNMHVAAELSNWPHIRAIALGGVIHPMSAEMVGPIPVQSATQLWQDVMFLGASGVDTDAGVTTMHDYESAVLRRMVEHSKRVVVLTRGSKVGQRGFSAVCGLDLVDEIVTTSTGDVDALEQISAQGVKVSVV